MSRKILLAFTLMLVRSTLVLAQTAKPGAVTPLSGVKFTSDGQPPCLLSALESGDPDTGPSTFILKAPPNCDIPWHFHTAEEQLFVVRGVVETEMEGMPAAPLAPGGFASMGSKIKHRFACKSKTECILFVTFDRKYDIVWTK